MWKMLTALTFQLINESCTSMSQQTQSSHRLFLRVPSHFTEQFMSRKHQGNGLQEQQNRATTLVFHEQWHEGAQCGYHSLYTLCKNHCSNLEESCMITQFTGKIIKSLVSFLFHYIACSLQCFLYEPEAGSPAWLCDRARQSSPIRSACAYTISETR